MMLHLPALKAAITETNGKPYRRDAGADGAPWVKPLVLVTANAAVGWQQAATGKEKIRCASVERLRAERTGK